MNVNFFLKEPTKEKTSVQAIIRYKGNRFKLTTGISVEVKFWEKAEHRARQTKEYPDYEAINLQLDRIEADIKKLFSAAAIQKQTPAIDEIKQLTKQAPPHPKVQTFIGYFRQYARSMNYKHRTALSYGSTAAVLEKYQQHTGQTLTFDTINIEFYNHFRRWINTTPREQKPNQPPKYYSVNTFGTFIKHIKTVMTAAGPSGDRLHTCDDYRHHRFVKETEEADTIYLSVAELKQIEEMHISAAIVSLDAPDLAAKHVALKVEALQRARAFFLIGCYTALRISDFSRLKPWHVTDKYIRIKPGKGARKNDDVVIPVHPVIRRILEGGFDITRRMSDQRFNEHVKELCRLAQITQPITTVRTEGGRQVSRTVEKWRLVASHTCRRSGATNMYLAQIPSISIMKITGHRTERSFLKYIRITQEENAAKLAEHPFFK